MTYRDLLISSRIPAVRAVSKLRAMKRGWIPIPIYKNIHFFVSKSENLFRVMPVFFGGLPPSKIVRPPPLPPRNHGLFEKTLLLLLAKCFQITEKTGEKESVLGT